MTLFIEFSNHVDWTQLPWYITRQPSKKPRVSTETHIKRVKKVTKLFSRSVQNWNINHKLILTSLQLFLFHVLFQSSSTYICFKITAIIIKIQLIIQAFSYTSHTDTLIPWLHSFSIEIKKLNYFYIISLLIDTTVSFKIYYYKFTLCVLYLLLSSPRKLVPYFLGQREWIFFSFLFLATQPRLWDLSSLTRDRTWNRREAGRAQHLKEWHSPSTQLVY